MTSDEHREHLFRLDDQWSLWRWVGVRGAGFPGRGIAELAASQSAALADAVVDDEQRIRAAAAAALRPLGADDDRRVRSVAKATLARLRRERDMLPDLQPTDATVRAALSAYSDARTATLAKRAELERVFQGEASRIARELRDIARRDGLREAVAWQNREAMSRFDELARTPEDATDKQTRSKELLVASYLQRYLVKNDTIGFFGPMGWAKIVESSAALEARPGATLLASRSVFFETWCLDAVARQLDADATLRPWMSPRLYPFLRIEGSRLHAPSREPMELAPAQAQVLAACDGKRTAKEIAAALVAVGHFQSPEEIFQMLELGRQLGVLGWSFQLPMETHPERSLRRMLERIEDPDKRSAALAPLNALERGRAAIAAAAGDSEAVSEALRAFDETFSSCTGEAPTRHPGEFVAARTLVYEDCRRDLEVTVGPELLQRLSAPLRLVLASMRWFTCEVARRYRAALTEILDGLGVAPGGEIDLPSVQLKFFQSESGRPGAPPARVTLARSELQRRWSELLPFDADAREVRFRSADLAAAAGAAFPCSGPGWSDARYLSPDILLRAASADAVRTGHFEFVLGEAHVGNTLCSSNLFTQHPAPDEIHRAVSRDFEQPVVVPFTPKDWGGCRLVRVVLPQSALNLSFTLDPSPEAVGRTVRSGDFVVTRSPESIRVRTRDGTASFDAVEFIGSLLTVWCANEFRMLQQRAHTPRIFIDDLIVERESWCLPAASLAFRAGSDRLPRFLEVRRAAKELGLPRFAFVKTALEPKPTFIDFESPIFVDLLTKLARAVVDSSAEGTATVTEMLPSLDETWLCDAAGERYTSELRFVALDALRPGDDFR